MCIADGGTKQKLHQFVIVQHFKHLAYTYLPEGEHRAGFAGTKTSAVSCFCPTERRA